jgi:hypothetical protein
MFAAFMLTQNAAAAGPRREDSYNGSVVELKVPVTPMSDTDQTRIRAGATPWRSPTLQARVAAATLTRKGPERQRLAGPQSTMPLGFLHQGPLTSRLRGGGEEPEKNAEEDAEAVSKGTGEPDETMPEPEEPTGTKPGLQELPGIKNESPGGRQTRSMTDVLLRTDETKVGKSKSSVVMPKGFEDLPPTDPQYQGVQGFTFGDIPPLGEGVSKDTTSNVTKGAGTAPSEDIGIVKPLEGAVELGSGTAPDPKGKAKENTAAVESVAHIPAPVWPAAAPAVPAQQISRPSLFRGPRFSAEDMAEGETSLKKRVTPTKGEKTIPCQDDGDSTWSDLTKAKYQRAGVQMVLGGPVTKNIRKLVKMVFDSDYCKDVCPEQGLVNYIFRGSYTQGLDSEFYMVTRTGEPAMYPTYSAVYNQDGLIWSTIERYTRAERQSVTPTEELFRSLSDGTELTADELQLFARGLVTIVDWVSTLPLYPPSIEGWTLEARKAHVLEIEYRMTILRYVLAMADGIMAETCPLSAQSHMEYRLLVEFYWMLHKIPEYLVQTDREGCCDKLRFMGERKAGLQELWNELGESSAGVQTMQRRMMLQLGLLERKGCIRLDQVWNSSSNADMNQAYLAASDEMTGLKEAPNEQLQNRAYVISHELGQALKRLAKGPTPKAEAQTRRERSPSVEMVESGARTTGKSNLEEGNSRSGPGKRGLQPGRRGGQPRQPRSGPWCCPNLSTCWWVLRSGSTASSGTGPTATTTRSGSRRRGTPEASVGTRSGA